MNLTNCEHKVIKRTCNKCWCECCDRPVSWCHCFGPQENKAVNWTKEFTLGVIRAVRGESDED